MIRRKPRYQPGPKQPPRIILTEASIHALQDCLEPEIQKQYEGIAYLLGHSDGSTTLAVSALRPEARTTSGSFDVSLQAMAKVVRAAANLGLQVVGQVHTHPGRAYHSNGDKTGARIAYSGYASIVLPDYGRHLPSLDGAAFYIYRASRGFVVLDPSCITIAPMRVI